MPLKYSRDPIRHALNNEAFFAPHAIAKSGVQAGRDLESIRVANHTVHSKQWSEPYQ